MKPSISVIAAARRFLAIPPRSLLSRKKKLAPSLTPLVLPRPSLSLSLSLLYARGDVDSLLGSNFYGDASSNISGLRLLALVFDERTSWSILSAGARPALASFLPYRSLDPLPRLRHLAFTSSSVSSDLPPSSLPLSLPGRLHLRCVSLENHSNTISDPTRIGPRVEKVRLWYPAWDERGREDRILKIHGTSFTVERMNEREIFTVPRNRGESTYK